MLRPYPSQFVSRASRFISARASRIYQEIVLHRSVYLAWLIWFIAFVLLVRSTLGGPDGNRYMAYIRSIVFDHDLLLINELEHFGQRVIITQSGYSAQIANVGVIPFWLPFYLLGVLSAWLSGQVGSGMASNYQLWLDFGDWVYGLLAMFVMYQWARTRFAKRTALASTILVCLGTPFIYYMTALAPSYHMISTLLCALFFYLWDSTRQRRPLSSWFGLGLLLGLLVSTAQYYAVLLVFPAFDFGFQTAKRDFRLRNSIQHLLSARDSPACLLLTGLVIPLVPQLIAWWITFGNPLANPYTLEANWSGAHIVDVLFSSYHGLYFFAPILLLATLGWLVGVRRDPPLYLGAMIALLGIAYTTSTRIGWWAGVSFGARYFIGLTPLFVMGFAQLVTRDERQIETRHPSQIAIPQGDRFAVRNPTRGPLRCSQFAIGALCALWTYGYFLQAYTNLTSFSEYHAASQWVRNQLYVASHFIELAAAHWAAPRSAALMANLAGFAIISLIIARWAASWLMQQKIQSNRWLSVLAAAPIAFSALLLTTIGPGDAHKQALAASGYYEKNLARDQIDFESFSGEYIERARYHEATGETEAARADVERAMALWPVKSRQMLSTPVGFQLANLKFGEQVELVGYQLEPGLIQPGQPLTVRLLWRALTRLPQDYDAGVLLIDSQGQVVSRTPPARGLDPFPATWWPTDRLIGDAHLLDVSMVPAPSLLKIRVELFDANARKRLPMLDQAGKASNGFIAEVKRASLEPASSARALATLDGSVSLLAYTFTREASNASLRLTWRTENHMEEDFTVFVHLLDAQEGMLAQSDAQPLGGRYPTHAWDQGEVVVETHNLTITPDALARLDHIAVGMYRLSDGKRLPSSVGGAAIILKGQ